MNFEKVQQSKIISGRQDKEYFISLLLFIFEENSHDLVVVHRINVVIIKWLECMEVIDEVVGW